jgi:hypothetical protein
MSRLLMVFVLTAAFGVGLVGCRAEVDTDTVSNLPATR